MTKAQLLMDCIADMMTIEGVDGMRGLVAGGVRLIERPAGGLEVRGEAPEAMGGGGAHVSRVPKP